MSDRYSLAGHGDNEPDNEWWINDACDDTDILIKYANRDFAAKVVASLNLTDGLTPECVAACVEAVKSWSAWKYAGDPGDIINSGRSAIASMDTAISLLPKEET